MGRDSVILIGLASTKDTASLYQIYPWGLREIVLYEFSLLDNPKCINFKQVVYTCFQLDEQHKSCIKTDDLIKVDYIENTAHGHDTSGLVVFNSQLAAINVQSEAFDEISW